MTLEPRLALSVTTAVADGDWLDPSTWDSGVPDADTRAIISQGVTVSLTGTSHVAKEVVVHGVLFADEELSPAVVGPDRVGVYFNGELTGTQQASQVWVHSDPIGIGSVAGGATRIDGGVLDSSNSGLRGSIDSIAVYNRALTEAEIAQIASGERNSGAAIDTQDAAAEWLFDAGPPLAGDYNGDNAVNAADYTVWLDAFGTNVASPGDGADGNGDGVVNAADYTVWRDGLGGVLDTAAATADNAPNDAIDDDGTLTGAGAALVDGALQLDGSSGIEVAPSAELTDGVFLEKTISLWFRTDSAGAFQVIYEQGDQERGLNLYLSRGSLYAGGWNTPEEESGWQGDWVVKSGITAGEWHHVALTLDAGYGAATGDVPVTSPANKSLTADWVHVNSGGVFQIGSQTDRYDTGTFSLTLTGDDPDADPVVETATGTMSIANNGAFLMTAGGGRLQFHGDEKLPFTKLAATADVGAGSLIVENVIERNFDGVTSAASDGSLDWAVGDQVVVASSSYSYQDEEVRTITSVVDLGNGTTELGLDQPLAERHFGGVETYSNSQRSWDIDLRAEVALLNRSIVVQGDEGSDTDNAFGDRALWNGSSSNDVADGVGGHVMIMPGSGQITLDSVNFDRLGQAGRLGRYPVHWHVGGDRSGDVLRRSSVTNSNNRGVTIHGTQNVLVEGNVLHDIHGHGFFQEDGAEYGNQYLGNIALGIHKVGGATVRAVDDAFVVPGLTRGPDGLVSGVSEAGDGGEGSHDQGQNIGTRFLHSAAYWITNPDNTWVGNVAAGAEGTGFWFVLPDSVIGVSLDTGLYDGYNPKAQGLTRFDHNTSHSAPVGLTFDRGEDIDPGSNNHYNPTPAPTINYLTGYKHSGSAVYHRGANTTFNESRFADNSHSSFNTFSQIEQNVLFVGHSRGNADTSQRVGGYRLYDGPGQIVDSHFAGFHRENAHTFRVQAGARKHSHTRAQGITFQDDGTADNVSIEWETHAAITTPNSPGYIAGRPDSFAGLVLDLDGSLTGHAGGGAGHVLVPKIDFNIDSTDSTPDGWDAAISDDRYGQLIVGANNGQQVPHYRISNGDGHVFETTLRNLNDLQRQYVKVSAGDYTIEFTEAIPSDGFSVFLEIRQVTQASDATVFRIKNVAATMAPTSGFEVGSIDAVRNATSNSYYRAPDGDLWWKVFESNTTRTVTTTSAPAALSAVDAAFLLFGDLDPAASDAPLEEPGLAVAAVGTPIQGNLLGGPGELFADANNASRTQPGFDPDYSGAEESVSSAADNDAASQTSVGGGLAFWGGS